MGSTMHKQTKERKISSSLGRWVRFHGRERKSETERLLAKSADRVRQHKLGLP